MITNRARDVLARFDRLVVSYSGGKDSTACLLWALETGLPVRVIWVDTGNELPETPEYLRYIECALGVKVEYCWRDGSTFMEMVRARKMWPIPGRCVVSCANKQDGFKWYLQSTDTPQSALLILGQRRSESASRAALPDFSPIVRSGLSCYRPILDWTLDDVFTYLGDKGVRAHPAYAKGRSRVGCVWCVNSRDADIVRDNMLYPERCAELRALRASIGLTSIPAGVGQDELWDAVPVCKYEAVHCE
jgi:3'-phosphoadenosine 5'-phosphosulfate sulfotransferase (PAPS reductase)/FAD synthetase